MYKIYSFRPERERVPDKDPVLCRKIFNLFTKKNTYLGRDVDL